MKKKNDDLVGKTVMVHPHLTTDPIQRQGETGKVIAISAIDINVASIEFSDKKRAAYMTDGLIILYPKAIILQGLQSNPNLPGADRKLISDVLKLAGSNKFGEALRIAMANDTTRFFCTTSCADWLELKARQKTSYQKRNRKN